MSSYDNEARALETQMQLEKGPEAFQSAEERQQVRRLLMDPTSFPEEIKSWMLDYLAVNGLQIPISQIVGFDRFTNQLDAQAQAIIDAQVTVSTAEVSTTQNTSSGTYGNLATTGPEVTDQSDGVYVILFGFMGASLTDVRGHQARMSVSINGAAAADADMCMVGVAAANMNDVVSTARAVVKTLSGGTNTITAKYRQENGGDAYFANRWLLAVRIGA